jgi:tetratricopeptide (TPR) repeat protein
VLPGILGSNLALDGRRIWLSFRFLDGLDELAWSAADADRIQPDGPVAGSYEALIERLGETHDVMPFAFDWRRPIEDEAKRLAAAVDAALSARKATGQPVRVVAHSLGGLVVRAMQFVAPRVWGDMMAHADARVLMLGVPNAGSWAPMQILSGDDTFGNALVAFGSLLHDGAARRLVAGMPGLMGLQAGLLDPATGLARRQKWQELVDADLAALRARSLWHDEGARAAIYDWSAPPQEVLDLAARLRGRLDAQLPALRGERKIVLVVGRADFTPTGFAVGEAGLEYLGGADAGDGRVTHESAMQLGVRTWRADAEHGRLPALREAFGAYVELLVRGDTTLLDTFVPAPAARDAIAPVLRSRPSRGLLPPVPPSSAGDVFGGARRAAAPAAAAHALELRVLNADLRYTEHALLVGHYSASRLTGAEQVVDDLVQNGMSRSLGVGLYPDAVGTHQVFGNARKDPTRLGQVARPAAAIVCGLGPEGKLTASDLAFTVRRAILAYAQRLADREGPKAAEFELASTLIGSGGVGVDPGNAAMAIAQGAIDARTTLAATPWPKLRRLHLVEVYLDRAGDAWRALKVQEGATPDRLLVPERIQFGDGALRRLPESGYRGASYDFISALLVVDGDPASPKIAYTLNTRRARTEIRATRAQGNLLRSMVEDASNAAAGDPDIGRTLFNLLIPIEMEPFLADRSGVVLELEPATAGIPWELLQTNRGRELEEDRPWAIRCGLVRKLRVKEFREAVRDASPDAHLLVIGEPNCDRTLYPRLDGARREAEVVAARLDAANLALAEKHKVTAVIGADAHAILNALFARAYRIVHIAGHGAPGPGGGVVLSGLETYLGVNEVEKMRMVPELVFLNCCHLAGREAASVLKDPPRPYDRASFAANIAEALIGIGVRCVIAAGWAVQDDAAEVFATRFYEALFTGRRFIDAVREAREAAWCVDRNGNTWAAYQCYGDPEWLWSAREGATGQAGGALKDYVDNIASPVSLTLALEKIIADGQYSAAGREGLRDRLRALEDAFGASWGRCGAVAEAFGVAHGSVRSMDAAIEWLRRAVEAEDGSASMQATEKLGNFLARRGEERAEQAAALADAPPRRAAMAAARRDVEEGIALLERLCALQPTTERENLLGSAYKRLTLVLAKPGTRDDAKAAADALAQAARHYAAAEERARRANDLQVFYPAYSRLAVEVRQALAAGRLPALDAARVQGIRDALRRASGIEPDFWNVVGETELEMLVALAQGRLAEETEAILGTLAELKVRVPAPLSWDSVRNNARFVLGAYGEGAATGADERAAAGRVLAALDAWADPAAKPE